MCKIDLFYAVDADDLKQVYLEFIDLFQQNRFAAQDKYQNFRVRLTGNIRSIDEDKHGKYAAMDIDIKPIDVYNAEYSLPNSVMVFPAEEVMDLRWYFPDTDTFKREIMKLRIGRTATIYGLFDSKNSSLRKIYVKQCRADVD